MMAETTASGDLGEFGGPEYKPSSNLALKTDVVFALLLAFRARDNMLFRGPLFFSYGV